MKWKPENQKWKWFGWNESDKLVFNYINPLGDIITSVYNLPVDFKPAENVAFSMIKYFTSEFWAGKINHVHSCNLESVAIRA